MALVGSRHVAATVAYIDEDDNTADVLLDEPSGAEDEATVPLSALQLIVDGTGLAGLSASAVLARKASLNLARCHFKCHRFAEAVDMCSHTLSIGTGASDDDVPALFLRARASMGLGWFTKAAQDANRAARLAPCNKQVQGLVADVAKVRVFISWVVCCRVRSSSVMTAAVCRSAKLTPKKLTAVWPTTSHNGWTPPPRVAHICDINNHLFLDITPQKNKNERKCNIVNARQLLQAAAPLASLAPVVVEHAVAVSALDGVGPEKVPLGLSQVGRQPCAAARVKVVERRRKRRRRDAGGGRQRHHTAPRGLPLVHF